MAASHAAPHGGHSESIIDIIPRDLLPRIVAHLQTPLDRYNASRATWRFEHALAQLGFRLYISSQPLGTMVHHSCFPPLSFYKYTLHQFRADFTGTGCFVSGETSTFVLNNEAAMKLSVANILICAKRSACRAHEGMKNARAFALHLEDHSKTAAASAATVMAWVNQFPFDETSSLFTQRPGGMESLHYDIWSEIVLSIYRLRRHGTLDVSSSHNLKVKARKRLYTDAALVPELDPLEGKARALTTMRKKWTAERKQSERDAISRWGKVV